MTSRSRLDNSFSSFERWLRAYRERNSGSHLFDDLPSPDGSLSGFWFWSPSGYRPWPERPEEQLLLAKVLLTLLGRLQTEKPFTIDFYGGQRNAANLGTGQVLLDGTILLDPELGKTFTERLDILAGLALHEIGHIKFTEPALAQKALARSKIFYLVAMILEDESIECRLGREAPGLLDFFQETKEYMFIEKLAEVPAPKDDYQELLGTLLLFIRYPLGLTPEMLAKWGEALEFVAEVLTPFPDTEEKVYDAAERIVERLFKVKEEEEQKQRAEGQPPTIVIPMPDRAGEIHPPSSIEEFIERMAQHSSSGVVSPEVLRRLQQLEQARAFVVKSGRGLPFPFSMPSGDGSSSPPGPIEFSEAPEAQEVYLRDLQAVRPYIRRLRQSLRFREAEHKEVLRRQETGRLEGRMLYAAPLGEERIFKQVKEERRPKTVVALVIDESGSMAVGGKIDRARQAAILFKEALEGIRTVDLYIYGHTADVNVPGTTQIFRYYSPCRRRRFSLGSIKARADNRDGVALEAIGREVLKKAGRAEEIIMFVLSDGIPAAHNYGGTEAIDHTRKAVQRLQRAGIKIIQIAIPPHGEPQKMFDHYLVFSDLGSLPREMASLLRRVLS